MTDNLAEALPKEQERVRELLKAYEEIGPAGVFGATMIKQDLRFAEEASAAGDVVKMIEAYKRLKECQ